MTLTTENILLIGSILMFVSVFAGIASHKFGVPVLILFLTIGMLAGSDGIGGIHFDNPKTAQFIGIVALNFILFSGGLDTDWKTVKPILFQGISLSTAGVFLTAGFVGIFVWLISDFSILEGLLLGAIVSSTDSAAVFSILRSKKLALKHNLRPTLELESGSNDPMAYLLTIVMTGLILNINSSFGSIIILLFQQLIVGTTIGFFTGKLGTEIINRINLRNESLYVALTIALMFFGFSTTDFLGGNGFLAVYISAVYIGNQRLIHKRRIIKSFESSAWLMQIVLFLTLGLLVYPSRLIQVAGMGLILSVFLILVARPISTFISLLPFGTSTRSKWFLSWVGLRGAVPIVFATYPLLAGIDKAGLIFNIVFFISLTSVLIQGTTLSFVARILGLTIPTRQCSTSSDELDEGVKDKLTEILLTSKSPVAGKAIVDLGLPPGSLISFIQRNQNFIAPTGSTLLQPGDKLYILTDNPETLKLVFACLNLPCA